MDPDFLNDDEELSDIDLEFLDEWKNMGKEGEDIANPESQVEHDQGIIITNDQDGGDTEGEPIDIEVEDDDDPEDPDVDYDDEDVNEGQGGIPNDGGEANSDDEEMGDPGDEAGEPETKDAPEDVDEDDSEEDDSEPQDEAEDDSEQPEGKGGDGEGEQKEQFDYENDLPPSPDGCDDHCEDNEPDSENCDACPHCTERIMAEREEWGVIGYDRDGKEILPGDKLHVVVPVAWTIHGSVLTANVPNEVLDRVAVSSDGNEDPSLVWLSGHAVSEFTGWHMKTGGAIWTFDLDKKIPFVELIEGYRREIKQEDIDDMIHEFEDMLDDGNDDQKDEDEKEDDLQEDEENDSENEDDPDNTEDDGDSEPDDDGENDEQEREKQKRHYKDGLTNTQKTRFENLADRIHKKALGTFGGTAEESTVGEIEDGILVGEDATKTIEIKSRGVTYRVHVTAEREGDL